MNLDKRENYHQDDRYFQDDETRYEDDTNDIVRLADHPISDNAEPDYANDFVEDDAKEFDEDEEKFNRKGFDEDPAGTDPNRNR
ncbi:hypothetical protein K6T82_11455 [Flavobacterium sp. 17A]|uniref:Uncharacterized protein n=1 Tax=Flavobacterium potami TaxID=2872310 RepID=A0A9X1HAY7_9FLAO|nr:hypothetical protein [Flavobacterium potami]MBZ4035385.1 hypothetical protein [Flavobacterium potami]